MSNGSDAAQKLAILAHLAFGARVDWKDIPRMGIDQAGYQPTCVTPKRWATASNCWPSPSWLATRWNCTFRRRSCRRGRPLSEVSGPFNAIRVVGDAVGELMFYGQGAGQMPTASAVVADIIDTAVGRAAITFRTLELWSNRQGPRDRGSERRGRAKFYLRAMVEDHPGVLAQVTQRAGRTISRSRPCCSRNRWKRRAWCRSLIMTHETTEAQQRACEAIDKLKPVRGETVRMWVRD